MNSSNSNTSPQSILPPVPAFQLARQALLKEIYLTPKPGLVDLANTGSHQDMDISTFLCSINAISPFLEQSYLFGKKNATLAFDEFFQQLRAIGQQAEQNMFRATQGINTHKGAIFAFILLLAAIGHLEMNKKRLIVSNITLTVAQLCQGLVAKDLYNNNGRTAGERLFNQYHLTGARGEAESGYQLVRQKALPCYRECRFTGHDEKLSLLQTMLVLMANNPDTNIVNRGGMEELNWVQKTAKNLLRHGGALTPAGINQIIDFDKEMIKKRLSPGGSADLIAVTWFLAQYPDN